MDAPTNDFPSFRQPSAADYDGTADTFQSFATGFPASIPELKEEDGYDLVLDAQEEWVTVEHTIDHIKEEKSVSMITYTEYVNQAPPVGPPPRRENREVFFDDPKELRALAEHLLKCAEWLEKDAPSA